MPDGVMALPLLLPASVCDRLSCILPAGASQLPVSFPSLNLCPTIVLVRVLVEVLAPSLAPAPIPGTGPEPELELDLDPDHTRTTYY